MSLYPDYLAEVVLNNHEFLDYKANVFLHANPTGNLLFPYITL